MFSKIFILIGKYHVLSSLLVKRSTRAWKTPRIQATPACTFASTAHAGCRVLRTVPHYRQSKLGHSVWRQIFLKTILADSGALKKRWPVDASEIETMYLIAENLVNCWDVIKHEFEKTKTLKYKNLLIAMMYQPWELCDESFTAKSAANKITLPAKNILRTVTAKHLYSD